MEFSFPWPESPGEWLGFASAAATVLIGLVSMFAPRIRLRLLGLSLRGEAGHGLGSVRGSLAGFPLGLGLAALLMAQPFLTTALGFSWALAAFGRVISMLSDGSGGWRNLAMLLAEIALAALPLAYAFGFVP